MRNLLSLLSILIVVFTSCEGRKTQRKALLESVKEFKKTVNLEIDVYQPETYMEREVDTLLSNGFHVKIKTYSDMDNSVLFSKIKDTINYQTYYRNYKFDIVVENDGEIIYKEHFDKSKINNVLGYSSNLNSEAPIYNFDTLAILKSIEISNELSSDQAVYIDIAYEIPNKEYIDWQKLKIDKNGKAIFTTMQLR